MARTGRALEAVFSDADTELSNRPHKGTTSPIEAIIPKEPTTASETLLTKTFSVKIGEYTFSCTKPAPFTAESAPHKVGIVDAENIDLTQQCFLPVLKEYAVRNVSNVSDPAILRPLTAAEVATSGQRQQVLSNGKLAYAEVAALLSSSRRQQQLVDTLHGNGMKAIFAALQSIAHRIEAFSDCKLERVYPAQQTTGAASDTLSLD